MTAINLKRGALEHEAPIARALRNVSVWTVAKLVDLGITSTAAFTSTRDQVLLQNGMSAEEIALVRRQLHPVASIAT